MKWIRIMLIVVTLAAIGPAVYGTVCGDLDQSGSVDISDLIYLVNYMFLSGPPPTVEPTTDCNGDGNTDISDLTYLVA